MSDERWTIGHNEYSFTGSEYATREEAIETAPDELGLEPGDFFSVGRIVPIEHDIRWLGDAEALCERACEALEVCDEVQDAVFAKLKTLPREAEEELSAMLAGWLENYGLHPKLHGFSVDNVDSFQVPLSLLLATQVKP